VIGLGRAVTIVEQHSSAACTQTLVKTEIVKAIITADKAILIRGRCGAAQQRTMSAVAYHVKCGLGERNSCAHVVHSNGKESHGGAAHAILCTTQSPLLYLLLTCRWQKDIQKLSQAILLANDQRLMVLRIRSMQH
jgi:predicted nucleic acid-binding Zn ribbon protein